MHKSYNPSIKICFKQYNKHMARLLFKNTNSSSKENSKFFHPHLTMKTKDSEVLKKLFKSTQ